MISFFRRFFQSKIGLPIFIGFLVLVALAFAAADITGSTFGGVTGGERVAVVGGEPVLSSELTGAANAALDQVRQQNPTLTMPEFVEQGGFDEVLRQLIDRNAVGIYAEKFGLRAGDNLINSEILKIGAFRSLTGEFDEVVYQQALRQRGITDASFRRDLRYGLLEQQIFDPAFLAPQMPEKVARQYAALVLERRRGEIALIPSDAYAPADDPSDAALEAYYREKRTQFMRPERRTLRFATFGIDTLDVDVTPTQAEIAARYRADAGKYEATERRGVSSFVVPTEDAAKAFVARLRAGLSLEAAAQDAGFRVLKTELSGREEISSLTSFAVMEKVFAAPEGGIADPARGALGWYVARVDAIERVPARSLAQASAEIAEQLRSDKRAAALADLSARIEEEIDSGTSLVDVAEAYGLELDTTPPVLADGRIFGDPQATIIPELAETIQTAFQMDESEPQIADLGSGTQFLIFDVARIEEAAAPPLAQIRADVVEGWRRAEGSKLARAAADRVLAKVRGTTALADALAAENKPSIERESIDLERRELLAQRGTNIAPPLVLLFSMAEGSAKVLEAPRDFGWYIVDLDEIATDPVDEEPGLLAQTRTQLAPTLRNEYRAQLTAAFREAIGIERNASAIEAVRKQLSGGS